MKNITFITGNAAKAEQLARHLEMPVQHKKIDLVEIQSLDLNEIVAQKVKEAYKIIQAPVLVEDVSLVFAALGRLPGPLIKWFLGELDNNGLCKLLDGTTDRSATAAVLYGLYDGKELKTYSGIAHGSIALEPRGERGFGFDPIFIPTGSSKTWGEMDIEEQTKTSMRRIALQKMEEDLRT